MPSNGPSMIVGASGLAGESGGPVTDVATAGPARLQRVADALDAGAAAGAAALRSTRPVGVPAADPTGVNARRAAVAAALQEWSGTVSGTLRTNALAVLAASRTPPVRQEATRASHLSDEETVFEAFFRGVEGRPAPQPLPSRGGRR